jgi:hypothetical protein
MRGAHFRAPTAQMTSAHPFGGPAHSVREGMPFGEYLPGHEEFRFDPFLEKLLGIISSTAGLFLGPVGYGKTTAMKIIAWRLFMLGAGSGLMRVAANDHRAIGGRSEYARLGDAMGCETYDIAKRSVNPFESQLQLGELSVLEMATLLCEHASPIPLVGSNYEALKIAVYKMLGMHELLWSPQMLQKLAFSIDDDDIDGHYRTMHDRLRGQIQERIVRSALNKEETDGMLLDLDRVYNRPDNIGNAEIIRAGEYIASLLSSLLEGKYGQMLGGKDSLYAMLTQRAIIKDWRGVPKDGVSLMRAIDHQIQINAIERSLHHLYPNIELDDEDHRSMEDLVYARSKAYKLKIIRSARLLSLSGSHRIPDYRKGGYGSELWSYGDSIINEMAFFFVSRMPNDKAILDELQDRFNLSSLDRTLLTELPPYVFGAKLGPAEPLTLVRFLPTETEIEFTRSDYANDEMVNRPGIRPDRYDQVAEATGIPLREEVSA